LVNRHFNLSGRGTWWLGQRYFSWQGSRELRREASNLKQLTKKLMLMMDDAELIEVSWDKDGNPVRVVNISASSGGSSSATATPTVVRQDEEVESESEPGK